jgi:hypothetical protein
MTKFKVGDICSFTPKDGSTRKCFLGKRCKVTRIDDIAAHDYQIELLDMVVDGDEKISVGWKCTVQEEQLEFSGPRPKYTTNELGDFPKKEAH